MKCHIQFRSEDQLVKGTFYLAPESSNKAPTLLLLSGFPGNEEDVLGLGQSLAQHGINTLTFNYRGIYQSEGRYSLNNSQIDIGAAIRFLNNDETIERYHIDPSKLILGGWSYGGGMGLIFAANRPDVKHFFSIAGTDHGEFARNYQRNEIFASWIDSVFEELKHPNGPVMFSGKIAIQEELLPNSDTYDFLSHATKLVDRNLLFIGGWDDINVTIEHHILPVYRALQGLDAKNLSIKAFQDNHSFENSREALTNSIAGWIDSLF